MLSQGARPRSGLSERRGTARRARRLEGLDRDAGGGLDADGDRRHEPLEPGHRLLEEVDVVRGGALHDERGDGAERRDVRGPAADRGVRGADAEGDVVQAGRVVPVQVDPSAEGLDHQDVAASQGGCPAGGRVVGDAHAEDRHDDGRGGGVDVDDLARRRVCDGHHDLAVTRHRHAERALPVLEGDVAAHARRVAGHEVDREDLDHAAAADDGFALRAVHDGVVAALGDDDVVAGRGLAQHDVGRGAVLPGDGLAVRLVCVELAVAEHEVELEAVPGEDVDAGPELVADGADRAGPDVEGLEEGVLAVPVLLGDADAVRGGVDARDHVLAAGGEGVGRVRAPAVAAEAEVLRCARLEGGAVRRDDERGQVLVVGVPADRGHPLVREHGRRTARFTLGPLGPGVALRSLDSVEPHVARGTLRSGGPHGPGRALGPGVTVRARVPFEGPQVAADETEGPRQQGEGRIPIERSHRVFSLSHEGRSWKTPPELSGRCAVFFRFVKDAAFAPFGA